MPATLTLEQPPGANADNSRPGPVQTASRPTIAPQQAAPPQQQAQLSDSSSPAAWVNTPRNSPCPCGSGKRYKSCHGDVSSVARA